MRKIDLERIIEKSGKNRTQIGKLLFADFSRPDMKLDRVLSGKDELTASQILTLSEFIGCSIDDLYGSFGWHSKMRGNVLQFFSNDYPGWCAELTNGSLLTSRIFYEDSLKIDDTVHAKSITLLEFVSSVKKQIEEIINQ